MVFIFGTGGLAKCCADAFSAAGVQSRMVAFGDEIGLPQESFQAIVAIGDNFKRSQVIKTLFEKFPKIDFVNAIHPSVILGQRVSLGAGNYIGAGSILGPDVKLGSHCVINAGVVVEHEAVIGDFVNIGTGSCFGGAITLKDRSLVGVGVSVIHGITVGEDAFLGSGSVVCAEVLPNSVMLGVPAKAKRQRKFGEEFL